ncbi:MAG: gliding motility-associated C-terminal domain-containing protein, partial [Bacteroidota bacterium]
FEDGFACDLTRRHKMKKINPFLLLFLLPLFCLGQSNEGVEFWFGFMEHRDVNQNTKVAMITAKTSTSGTISVPLQGWSEEFTVAANAVTIITLPRSTETVGSEFVTENGVLVRTNDPASVYIHQYHSMRSEAAVVLPTAAIGDAYYVMTYQGVTIQNTVFPAEFLVVAREDETEVTITVSDETRDGKPPGTTFTVLLNAGETYQVQARRSSGDLTGSFVRSDKKFSLFAGNSWTQVPDFCEFRDNLLEQMYPLSTWGRRFITVPNDKVSFDVFRILAAEDNTTIEVQSTPSNTYNLDAGEFVEYQLSAASFIMASQPILVAQFSVGQQCNGHSLGDPSMVLLNSVEQTRDTVTLFNSSFENIEENFINVITRSVDTDIVFFDNQQLISTGVTFTPVGPNGEFAYARIRVEPGAHTIISEGCGVIATAYGYGNVESYAYSGGASFSAINANPIPEGGCLNDTIYFDTGLSPFRFSFDWDLGDGTTSDQAVFSHFYPALGAYPVRLITYDECLDIRDTFYRDLMITLRQAVEVIDDQRICEGERIELGASGLAGARYEWSGPNNFFSEAQFPFIDNAQLRDSGRYSVIGIISGCATFPADLQVDVLPIPAPDLGPDTILCSREGFTPILDPGTFSSYRWQNRSRNPTLRVQQEGQYWVEVSNELGCTASDTVLMREQCPTRIYIPNAFSPNDDGINDEFGAFGTDIIRFQLRIFNRWGGVVFESKDPEGHWDGFINGEPAQEGVYTWMIELEGYQEDGSTYTEVLSGNTTLLR